VWRSEGCRANLIGDLPSWEKVVPVLHQPWRELIDYKTSMTRY
jgi:hypothetical protein